MYKHAGFGDQCLKPLGHAPIKIGLANECFCFIHSNSVKIVGVTKYFYGKQNLTFLAEKYFKLLCVFLLFFPRKGEV